MFTRRDITKAPLSAAEDRGVNEKIWIIDRYEDENGIEQGTGKEALFKVTQIKNDTGDSTYADFGEVITTDVCKILGVGCAETELVIRDGKNGVLSFQFLDKERGDELIDIGSVIQNTGRAFDTKRMEDTNTKEQYTVEMILEGLESLTPKKGEFSVLKQEFLKQVLVDSLIDHYDRNPSNMSVVRNKDGVYLSKKYDNGTCCSISVPEHALRDFLGKPCDLRQKVQSKIGYLNKNYQQYPDLESFILNYYYDDVKDFVEIIKDRFTDDNIDAIFTNSKYEDLPNVHKQIIREKLKSNRDALLDRYRKISKKHIIDKIIFNKSASENFKKHVQKGTIFEILPEYKECIGMQDSDPDFDLTLDEQVAQKIQNTVDIIQLSRYLEIPLEALTPREKNLLKWNIIIQNMQKANPDKNIFEELAERCGFLSDDIQLLRTMINRKFKDGKDVFEARDIIYGDNGIGEDNINIYLSKKFVDASVMRKDIREKRYSELRDLISTMDEAVELEHISQGKLKIKSRNIMALGNNEEQTTRIRLEIAKAYKQNPRMSYDEQFAMAKSMSEIHFENDERMVKLASGAFVDAELFNFVNTNTVTLEGGKKIAFVGGNRKAKDVAIKMGLTYVAQIVPSIINDGVTFSVIAAKGEKFPKSVENYISEIEKYFEKRFGKQDSKQGYIRYRLNTKSNFFAIVSASNPEVRIPNVTEEQMKQILIDRFNGKENIRSLDE